MENKKIDVIEYIQNKIDGYEPGPRPATGPRPLSKQKYQAVLLRALTNFKLAEIAETVGATHGTVRQWSRQRRFNDEIQAAQHNFAAFFADHVAEVFSATAEEFKDRWGKWMQTDDASASPDPRPVEFLGIEALPDGLQVAIFKELVARAKESDFAFLAAFRFEQLLFPGAENSNRRRDLRLELIGAYAEVLQPVIEGKELTLQDKKQITVLQELLQRAGALNYAR